MTLRQRFSATASRHKSLNGHSGKGPSTCPSVLCSRLPSLPFCGVGVDPMRASIRVDNGAQPPAHSLLDRVKVLAESLILYVHPSHQDVHRVAAVKETADHRPMSLSQSIRLSIARAMSHPLCASQLVVDSFAFCTDIVAFLRREVRRRIDILQPLLAIAPPVLGFFGPVSAPARAKEGRLISSVARIPSRPFFNEAFNGRHHIAEMIDTFDEEVSLSPKMREFVSVRVIQEIRDFGEREPQLSIDQYALNPSHVAGAIGAISRLSPRSRANYACVVPVMQCSDAYTNHRGHGAHGQHFPLSDGARDTPRFRGNRGIHGIKLVHCCLIPIASVRTVSAHFLPGAANGTYRIAGKNQDAKRGAHRSSLCAVATVCRASRSSIGRSVGSSTRASSEPRIRSQIYSGSTSVRGISPLALARDCTSATFCRRGPTMRSLYNWRTLASVRISSKSPGRFFWMICVFIIATSFRWSVRRSFSSLPVFTSAGLLNLDCKISRTSNAMLEYRR